MKKQIKPQTFKAPAVNFAKIDADLDFDLDDFNLSGIMEEEQRICRPRMDAAAISKTVLFENAQTFAHQIDLTPGARTFAWVNGNFVFGDIVEALVVERNVCPSEIYISTLSMDQENIDSLFNVLSWTNARLFMLVSGYYYSHERNAMIPYMYEQLDHDDRFQVAFGNYHSKVIAIKTEYGNSITIHGSANLRSSNSIEQIDVEINNAALFDFNAGIIRELCDQYGTINHSIPNIARGTKSWQAVREAAKKAVPNW